ncbi:Gliding motility-associated ABC transporter ATP-binding protein GldA [hydrothermal vent metagenome]|uniref:Gliding motility-associated ABC transporter ATP-binding protein GldA n=1 Tax=hydrothermal vent metagenome TaxID=652676 RepID=A0A3B0YTW2_9ZZZZ
MSALIQAQHLHRRYADTHAVDDVSIHLQQGDILGLLGPNGAGKSSCLQMLCGVLAPTAGEILINGIDLLDRPQQAKQHIGYLADKPPLYPELSVDEYLTYAARLRKVPKAQLPALLDQAKQRCALGDYAKRLIANLSKGYQQRVGIAQAIIHQPDVIILDEPTVGLDPIQMREIRNLITELGAQHGIILSTHILPEVQAVCNRVQLIHQGKSVFNKPMHEIQQHEKVLIHLQQPPETQALLKIPTVQSIENIDPINTGRYLLSGNNLARSLTQISEYCVAQGWGLREIHLQQNSLEQIFLQLTTGEDSLNNNGLDNNTAQKVATA